MSICYRIKDWAKHFENSESRKYKSLSWVPMKNKHDGKGYRRVVSHPKSIQVFCAWSLLVQVASKMPVRGLLRDEDGPLTTTDLAFKTGFPESIFEEAFRVLVEPKIGWLEMEKSESVQRPSETPGETTGEQNGTEVHKTEQNGTSYSTVQGERGAGKGAAPRADGMIAFADVGRLAGEIMGNEWGWSYDNCRVKIADFTLAGLQTVLRPFVGRATSAQVRKCWCEAVNLAHGMSVDFQQRDQVKSAAGLATEKFRELMGRNSTTDPSSLRYDAASEKR